MHPIQNKSIFIGIGFVFCSLSPSTSSRSGSTGSISGLPRAKAQLNVKVGDQGGHTHELMLSVADQLRHGTGRIIQPYPYPYS